MSSWRDSLTEQLVERDTREKQHDVMILAFQEAASRCIAAEENTFGGVSGKDGDDTDELTRLYSELSLKTEAWKKLKEDLKIMTHKYTELKKDAETNKETLRKYEKQCNSLKREAQNAKDELLALQIQLNISEENNRKLKEDNSALVDRWMKKVEGEASKMNEANEFLQRIEKLRSKAKEDPLENS